jgi:hypothetical protein
MLGLRPSAASGSTDRAEVGGVAALLAAGSEKAAAHRLGLSRSTVKHHLANARNKVGADTTGAAGVDPGAAAPGARGQSADGRLEGLPDGARRRSSALVGAQDPWSTFICAIHASRVGTTGSTKAMTK